MYNIVMFKEVLTSQTFRENGLIYSRFCRIKMTQSNTLLLKPFTGTCIL